MRKQWLILGLATACIDNLNNYGFACFRGLMAEVLIPVELVRRQLDRCQLLIADFDPGCVPLGVQRRAHRQPRARRCTAYQTHERLKSHQRHAAPIQLDVAEQPVLHLVPLARPRREVQHPQHKPHGRPPAPAAPPSTAATGSCCCPLRPR